MINYEMGGVALCLVTLIFVIVWTNLRVTKLEKKLSEHE